MMLPDVNIYLSALRRDNEHHVIAASWLEENLSKGDGIALWDNVLASVVRIATREEAIKDPHTLANVFSFMDVVRTAPAAITVLPGVAFWGIFRSLVEASNARGNLVTDCMIAAVAIERGCTVVTFDKGFAKIPGVPWMTPY